MTPKTYEILTKLASKLEYVVTKLGDIEVLTKGKPRRIAEELKEIIAGNDEKTAKGLLEEEVPYIFDILKNGEKLCKSE